MADFPSLVRLNMLDWQELLGKAPAVLTIVGMAKNVGKTVTLNYVQKLLQQEGWSYALTSIGRDGEKRDALTNLPKPPIVVPPGAIIATAEQLIENQAEWEYLQNTRITTPLGKIIILRARSRNRVVVAGPGKNRDVQALLQHLAGRGCRCILIDGAFDRQSAADPLVSSQVILATGAAVSRDLAELISLTQSRVQQLTLPVCSEVDRQRAAASAARVMLVAGGEYRQLFLTTSLLPAVEWNSVLGPDCSAIIVKGAVGDGLAEALLAGGRSLTVIVQDGSKIFINSDLWRRLAHCNIRFQALRPIQLLGVTINPTCPGKAGFEPDLLLRAMGAALAPVLVLDVWRETRFEDNNCQ